jgi:hypothetical protein
MIMEYVCTLGLLACERGRFVVEKGKEGVNAVLREVRGRRMVIEASKRMWGRERRFILSPFYFACVPCI